MQESKHKSNSTMPPYTLLREQSGNAGLITGIVYPDGSKAAFEYDGDKLIQVTAGRYVRLWTGDLWIEHCDKEFNGFWDRLELVMEDNPCHMAGTLVCDSESHHQVISPLGKYSVGFDEQGRIHSISYPDDTFRLIEYGHDGKLLAACGPMTCASMEDVDGRQVVNRIDPFGKPIAFLSLAPVDQPNMLNGNVSELVIVEDKASPYFGTILAAGACGLETMRLLNRPDGSAASLFYRNGVASTLCIVDARGAIEFYQKDAPSLLREEGEEQLLLDEYSRLFEQYLSN